MFKNRALQVRMVKDAQKGDDLTETEVQHIDPEQLNRIAKEQVKHIAIAVGSVIAGRQFLNTVSEIAVIAAKAKIR